jgi:hypothetical protein
MNRLTSLIASPPDRENLVFEIWLESHQLAEVSLEPGKSVEIEIYPPTDGEKWSLELGEFMSILDKACEVLHGK